MVVKVVVKSLTSTSETTPSLNEIKFLTQAIGSCSRCRRSNMFSQKDSCGFSSAHGLTTNESEELYLLRLSARDWFLKKKHASEGFKKRAYATAKSAHLARHKF